MPQPPTIAAFFTLSPSPAVWMSFLPSCKNTVSSARNATRRVKGKKEGWCRRGDSVGFYAHSKKIGHKEGKRLGRKEEKVWA